MQWENVSYHYIKLHRRVPTTQKAETHSVHIWPLHHMLQAFTLPLENVEAVVGRGGQRKNSQQTPRLVCPLCHTSQLAIKGLCTLLPSTFLFCPGPQPVALPLLIPLSSENPHPFRSLRPHYCVCGLPKPATLSSWLVGRELCVPRAWCLLSLVAPPAL